MGIYVAVLESFAVRDVEYCTTENNAPESPDWSGLDGAEVFLGVYRETNEESARAAAAAFAETVPENIRIIQVDMT